MFKILKILAGVILLLFLVVIIGGYIFVKTFNFNDYKNDVAELASKKLGRQLSINGNASIGLSLFPTIIIEDVELANAVWAKNPTMVKVKYFEIQFALMPLLKKQIEISKISLIEPQINLEVAKDGQKNWVFDLPKTQEKMVLKSGGFSLISEANASPVNEVVELDEKGFSLVGLTAESVSLKDGIVTYDNQGKITNLKISSMDLAVPSADEQIRLKFVADIDGALVSGQATAGSVNNFLHKSESYPVILTLKAYGVDVAIDGIISNPMDKLAYNLKLNVYNPAGNFSLPETTLETQVKGDLKKIHADISLLNIVNNKISGTVDVNLMNKVPYINANLNAPIFDLRVFNQNSPMASLLPDLITSVQASELVPNTPIPYNLLKPINADMKISIGRLIINEAMQVDNVNFSVMLKDSVLAINPFNMKFGGGDVNGSLVLAGTTQKASLKLMGKNLLLQNLHKEFQVAGAGDFGVSSGGNLDFDINLKSNGTTVRSMFNNLNGQVAGVVGQTQFQTGQLKFLTSNFVSQLLNVLGIKTSKTKNIDVACVAIHSDLANGKANFPNGIALESKQMNIVSTGNINLLNDKIDFSIKPNITDVNIAQAISSFIKIKGTLQEPKLALDNTSTAKAIVGVVATGGTAYLGSQLMSADTAPCYNALQGTVYANKFSAPTGATNAVKDMYQGVEKQVSDGINGIKNTAKGVINMFKNSFKSNNKTSNGAQ